MHTGREGAVLPRCPAVTQEQEASAAQGPDHELKTFTSVVVAVTQLLWTT